MAASNTEKLLDLYFAGELDNETNLVVQGWLLHDTPEQDSYLRQLFERIVRPRRFSNSYTRRSFRVIERELGFEDAYAHAQRAMRHVAVMMLVLAVAVGGILYRSLPQSAEQTVAMQKVSCEAGSTLTVAFPDGTRVTLKGESEIAFAGDYASHRHITLEGEAFFSVAHDAERPFSVSGNGIEVEVLGTEFNMHTGVIAEVVLISGSVEVASSEHHVILAPGQKAKVDTMNETVTLSDVGAGELARYSGQPLVFNDVALDEVLRSIGDYFEVQMEVAASVPQVERVVFDIDADASLEQAMKLLQATNPVFKYAINGNRVTVK
jgi:ferric-dicitrate binding protein FerR (iron transport regulator)